MFDKVKEIIDQWDPIDLLSIHCPNDEYDDISFSISQKVETIVDVEELANYIFNLFVQEFDVSTFQKTMDDCRIIASKISESKLKWQQ